MYTRSLVSDGKALCYIEHVIYNLSLILIVFIVGDVVQVVPQENLPSIEAWWVCEERLCDITIQTSGIIENAGPSTLQVRTISQSS